VSAFDDHVHDALNRTLEGMRAHLESDIAACRDDLFRAVADASSRAEAQAKETASADAQRDVERQLTEWREAAAREAEERDRDLDARIRQAEAREHDAEAREHDADARRQEAEARHEAAEKTLEELRRSFDDERHQGRTEVEAARADASAARQEGERAKRVLEQRLEDANKHAEQEIVGLNQEIRGLNDALAQAARLPLAIEQLDHAASLGEALDGLARCAAAEAGRAIVFLAKGGRLRDWRSIGFDGSHERLEILMDEPGLFADAMRNERGSCRGADTPAFAASEGPRYAITLPVTVGGVVVAVLYADGPDADKETEPIWPARLDVLARYAGRVLESITIRQAAGLSAAGPSTASAMVGHPPAGSVQ